MAVNYLLLESGSVLLLETSDKFILEQGSYTFAADGGSYAVTGSPSINSTQLAAVTGVYTLSGVTSTLTATRYLASAIGSYALSGVSAGLVNGKKLIATPGSYSLSGVSAEYSRLDTLPWPLAVISFQARHQAYLELATLLCLLGCTRLVGPLFS